MFDSNATCLLYRFSKHDRKLLNGDEENLPL